MISRDFSVTINPDPSDWPETERCFNFSRSMVRTAEAERRPIGEAIVLFFVGLFTLHKAWLNGWIWSPGKNQFISRGTRVP